MALALLAAFLLTLLRAYCYFRTQSKMRSKQQNKFDVPAASGGENIYCLTTSHLRYGWLVQWRHSSITKTGCPYQSGLEHCLWTIKLHLRRAFPANRGCVLYWSINKRPFYIPNIYSTTVVTSYWCWIPKGIQVAHTNLFWPSQPAQKCFGDTHSPQRMNPYDSDEPQTFPQRQVYIFGLETVEWIVIQFRRHSCCPEAELLYTNCNLASEVKNKSDSPAH